MKNLEFTLSKKRQTILPFAFLIDKGNELCSQEAQQKDLAWNQWLAGTIDGDGYLAIQKSNKLAVCEITMPLEDKSLLFVIKQKLGGSITRRSGVKARPYRLCHQSGMVNLINRINGCYADTIRLEQFQTLWNHFNICYLVAEPLTLENGYLAGFFDTDGTIYISVNKTT